MTPVLLTIGDQTMSITQWSRQPGAVKYHTIIDRLRAGWDDDEAVFRPAGLGKRNTRTAPRFECPKRRRAKSGKRFPVSLTQWGSVLSVNFPVTDQKDLVDLLAC